MAGNSLSMKKKIEKSLPGFGTPPKDFGTPLKKRHQHKMDLTFLIRRLRSRGKNEFEALNEINRSMSLDFEKQLSIMNEKTQLAFKIFAKIYWGSKIRVLTAGIIPVPTGIPVDYFFHVSI